MLADNGSDSFKYVEQSGALWVKIEGRWELADPNGVARRDDDVAVMTLIAHAVGIVVPKVAPKDDVDPAVRQRWSRTSVQQRAEVLAEKLGRPGQLDPTGVAAARAIIRGFRD